MSDDELNEELIPVSDREAERIAALARAAYHQPPAAPREDMWQAINASRGKTPSITPITSARRAPWWIAVAAAAVLAAGIGIGRLTAPRDAAYEVTAADPGAGVVIPVTGLEDDSVAGPVTPGPRPQRPQGAQPRSGTRETIERSDATYRLAMLQHLAESEMLLTEYRVNEPTDRPTLGPWARDLLGTTRLLMDSPAAEDARLRPLLEDLELVLAQIVQHAGARGAGDRAFVNRALEERALLEKLRAAVPASAVISGSE